MQPQRERRKQTRLAYKPLRLVCLLLVLALGFELLCSSWHPLGGALVEARYFPTRADETSVQALKELIQSIIGQSRQAAGEQQADIYGYRAYQPAPLQQAAARIQQRSPATSLETANELGQYSYSPSGVKILPRMAASKVMAD